MTKCSIIDILRKPKIFNMALFDFLLVLIIAGIIGYFFNKYLKKKGKKNNVYISIVISFIILIIIGIFVHYIFNIPTYLNYYLGLNTKHAVLKNRKKC